jgi:hypothetical protein
MLHLEHNLFHTLLCKLWCSSSVRLSEMCLALENVIPCSFNATLMLEMLRGKRMLFVGDSLNRGQYVSLVCLLHRFIPESSKSMETFDSLTVFRAKVFIDFRFT